MYFWLKMFLLARGKNIPIFLGGYFSSLLACKSCSLICFALNSMQIYIYIYIFFFFLGGGLFYDLWGLELFEPLCICFPVIGCGECCDYKRKLSSLETPRRMNSVVCDKVTMAKMIWLEARCRLYIAKVIPTFSVSIILCPCIIYIYYLKGNTKFWYGVMNLVKMNILEAYAILQYSVIVVTVEIESKLWNCK